MANFTELVVIVLLVPVVMQILFPLTMGAVYLISKTIKRSMFSKSLEVGLKNGKEHSQKLATEASH